MISPVSEATLVDWPLVGVTSYPFHRAVGPQYWFARWHVRSSPSIANVVEDIMPENLSSIGAPRSTFLPPQPAFPALALGHLCSDPLPHSCTLCTPQLSLTGHPENLAPGDLEAAWTGRSGWGMVKPQGSLQPRPREGGLGKAKGTGPLAAAQTGVPSRLFEREPTCMPTGGEGIDEDAQPRSRQDVRRSYERGDTAASR
jgi:hypothetical protein